jgi:hypothetical protein
VPAAPAGVAPKGVEAGLIPVLIEAEAAEYGTVIRVHTTLTFVFILGIPWRGRRLLGFERHSATIRTRNSGGCTARQGGLPEVPETTRACRSTGVFLEGKC